MVVTVFLLFCTVLSFTWGPKCILCVSIVIYQEFCEILWRVFVLVLLYLVSCIFSTVSSLSMSNSLSLTYSFSVLPFFQSQLVSNSYAQYFLNLTERRGGVGGAIDIYQKNTRYYREKEIKLLKVSDLISVCKNFQGNGHLNTRAELRLICLLSVWVPLKSIFKKIGRASALVS